VKLLAPDDGVCAQVLPPYQHIRPQAVARCSRPEDVAEALEYARDAGLHVVPRGGGHCFAGRSSTEGVVLDLSPMNSVTVSDGVATIGAGARLAEVYAGLDSHGLTLPAGCGATVGIAGLTLGGGLGLLGRRYGLTCDRLRAAEVVLVDGRIVVCCQDSEPDLFWALRGAGGGQFGVVTSLDFDPVPTEPTVRFLLTWPVSAAADVLSAWQDIAPDAPDEVNVNLKIGGDQVTVFGAGSPPRELLRLAPATRSVTTLPYYELKQSFDDLGSVPEPTVSKSEFFARSLPADAITALLGEVSPGRELNFTPMGGAYNRTPPTATAFVHRGERFVLEHVASHADAAWVRASWARAHEFASGRVYPNFPDPDLTDWATAYHGENHARLAAIKSHYDPDHVLHFPQSL
jgi:FAD/FMN-containing dehydrogenase